MRSRRTAALRSRPGRRRLFGTRAFIARTEEARRSIPVTSKPNSSAVVMSRPLPKPGRAIARRGGAMTSDRRDHPREQHALVVVVAPARRLIGLHALKDDRQRLVREVAVDEDVCALRALHPAHRRREARVVERVPGAAALTQEREARARAERAGDVRGAHRAVCPRHARSVSQGGPGALRSSDRRAEQPRR